MSNEFEKATTPRRRLNRSKALLIGFPPQAVADITEALETIGWAAVSSEDSDHAARECATEQFDFVLIDVDGVDQFAPELITAIRDSTSMSARSTIVAFSNYIPPAFKDRLVAVGVDGFCALPLKDGVLVASLTQASVNRARSANLSGMT
ncbi:MAG: hypothetical protein AAF601_08580 [Pseudomonadota bacterium]